MAKMSRGQYLLITEAMGEGLADVEKLDSPMLRQAAVAMIQRMADHLEYDNPNFDRKQFISGVTAHADLQKVMADMDINIA
jgi:hypothetical protein